MEFIVLMVTRKFVALELMVRTHLDSRKEKKKNNALVAQLVRASDC